jgi:outer membrane protein assembly factor BamB
MTVGLTRATSLTPPTQLAFFGFARPPRPAKGDVGEPGKGAPQLAEIAARQAARNPGRGSDTPAPARGAQPATKSLPPNFVFSVAADGLLRGLIPDTGDLALAPARLLPPNSTATGLIWADGVVYAATSNACGSAPTGVFAMDFLAEKKPVTTWQTNGAGIAGLSLGLDGTVYASTGGGSAQYANSVVALDGKTLQVKDWYTTANGPFISAPVVFVEGNRPYVAVAAAGGLHLLDGQSLGGVDHRTPLSRPEPAANVAWRPEAVATWRDPAGTRWILGVMSDSIAAFKMVDTGSRTSLQPGWTSRKLVRPRTPIVVNDVLFVLGGGDEGSNAVLYALDPGSGRELWNSGTAITSFASGNLSAGTGQVHVVTADNTVWAFGIPLAIN